MNYTEKDKRFQITEQGRRRIRSLLAGQGKYISDLGIATGWNERIYRILRGTQYMTCIEFDLLDYCLFQITGANISETDHHNVGRLS